MEQQPADDGAEGRPSYRFLLRPKWLLSHAFVLFLVIVMVNLGFWQLRRLDERRDRNATIREHAAATPAPLPAAPTPAEVDDLEWRPVAAEGRYRAGSDVLVANRTLDGQPGYWLVTLLEPSGGATPVAVVRGFVTRTLVSQGEVAQAAPAAAPVSVVGYAQSSRGGGRFATGTEGDLAEISRVDLGRLAEHWGTDLAPVWLQLATQDPPPSAGVLTPVPLPPQDEGPHLSYAVQWFLFSTIALVGYPLALRRIAQSRARGDDDPGPPDLAGTRVRGDGAIQ